MYYLIDTEFTTIFFKFCCAGSTSILHDSELQTDVGNCADPGCYSRPIRYNATMRQMNALADLSNECHQLIKVKEMYTLTIN